MTPRGVRTPALAAWHREFTAGERTASVFDWLWRAACWEAAAQQAGRMSTRARHCLERAREITERATRGAP